MISGIGSSSMPSMSQMSAMKDKAFKSADGDGNGTLSVDEFKGLMSKGPMGAKGPGGTDAESAFKTADANSDGQLTKAEMETGMKNAMANFQSTMSRFSSASKSDGGDDNLKQLLKALDEGQSAQSSSGASSSGAALQRLLDRLQSATGVGSGGGSRLAVQA